MIKILTALADNYIYLIIWGNMAIAVDPTDSQPVISALQQNNLKLEAILITHHHWDHTGGVEALVTATGCQVIGPKDARIPQVTRSVTEGDSVSFGSMTFEILATPGHTTSHIVYYEPRQGWLFSGDTLFGGGCGRLFEGSPKQMLDSLNKIYQLPDNTKIFCGHEYTVKNLEFAASIEPSNKEVADRLEMSRTLRRQNTPTIPSTLGIEKTTNPFLRSKSPSLKQALHMNDASDLEVFTRVREMRNSF